MEIKCLKSPAKFFFKLNSMNPCLGLSNDLLCILGAQGAAKLSAVKIGCLKKSAASAIIAGASVYGPGSSLTGFKSFSKFYRW